MEKLFEVMIIKDSRKLIVEVPLDVITSLNKCLTNANMLSSYYRFKIWNISLGSLVNLSKYFTHFSVRAPSKQPYTNWMQIEIKMSKKYMNIYFYLNSRSRM